MLGVKKCRRTLNAEEKYMGAEEDAWDEEEEIETEYFITSQPMCYSERHIRALKGEVF